MWIINKKTELNNLGINQISYVTDEDILKIENIFKTSRGIPLHLTKQEIQQLDRFNAWLHYETYFKKLHSYFNGLLKKRFEYLSSWQSKAFWKKHYIQTYFIKAQVYLPVVRRSEQARVVFSQKETIEIKVSVLRKINWNVEWVSLRMQSPFELKNDIYQNSWNHSYNTFDSYDNYESECLYKDRHCFIDMREGLKLISYNEKTQELETVLFEPWIAFDEISTIQFQLLVKKPLKKYNLYEKPVDIKNDYYSFQFYPKHKNQELLIVEAHKFAFKNKIPLFQSKIYLESKDNIKYDFHFWSFNKKNSFSYEKALSFFWDDEKKLVFNMDRFYEVVNLFYEYVDHYWFKNENVKHFPFLLDMFHFHCNVLSSKNQTLKYNDHFVINWVSQTSNINQTTKTLCEIFGKKHIEKYSQLNINYSYHVHSNTIYNSSELMCKIYELAKKRLKKEVEKKVKLEQINKALKTELAAFTDTLKKYIASKVNKVSNLFNFIEPSTWKYGLITLRANNRLWTFKVVFQNWKVKPYILDMINIRDIYAKYSLDEIRKLYPDIWKEALYYMKSLEKKSDILDISKTEYLCEWNDNIYSDFEIATWKTQNSRNNNIKNENIDDNEINFNQEKWLHKEELIRLYRWIYIHLSNLFHKALQEEHLKLNPFVYKEDIVNNEEYKSIFEYFNLVFDGIFLTHPYTLFDRFIKMRENKNIPKKIYETWTWWLYWTYEKFDSKDKTFDMKYLIFKPSFNILIYLIEDSANCWFFDVLQRVHIKNKSNKWLKVNQDFWNKPNSLNKFSFSSFSFPLIQNYLLQEKLSSNQDIAKKIGIMNWTYFSKERDDLQLYPGYHLYEENINQKDYQMNSWYYSWFMSFFVKNTQNLKRFIVEREEKKNQFWVKQIKKIIAWKGFGNNYPLSLSNAYIFQWVPLPYWVISSYAFATNTCWMLCNVKKKAITHNPIKKAYKQNMLIDQKILGIHIDNIKDKIMKQEGIFETSLPF